MTEKARFWHDHFTAWQASSLSQSAYCEQHGLKLSNFTYWRSRHNRQQRKLVPITMPTRMQPERMTLDLPYGVRLELSASSLSDVLPAILRALRELP